MKCSKCGIELTEDMFIGKMCFNCGNPIAESEKLFSAEKKKELEEMKQKDIEEQKRRQKENIDKVQKHKVSTGYNFENYEITEYIGLVSGESVIGTGWFSTIEAGLSDFLGSGAATYSEKMKKAKEEAIIDMITESIKIEGNAIIGISFQFLTFSGDMIGVSVNGTAVKIRKIEK